MINSFLKKIKKNLKCNHPGTYRILKKNYSKMKELKKSVSDYRKKLDSRKKEKIQKKTERLRLEALRKENPYFQAGEKIFRENYPDQKQLPSKTFRHEYRKYMDRLDLPGNKDSVIAQMAAVLGSEFILKSNRLKPSRDPLDPTVFVVVRNELERMKIFFNHYRKLGVHQFVVLDNDSDDGTLEYLSSQNGTKVYQVKEKYQTQKREGWIEKLLALNGLNRWCVAVDSDELLDYMGSEDHTLYEMIQKGQQKGYKRLIGFMLDMYSKDSLFSADQSKLPLTETYRYFDREGYFLDRAMPPNKSFGIHGGPRFRMFQVKQEISKQSVFYFDKDTVYKTSHTLLPAVSWGEVPCWFVLRHYKFISTDRAEYERRIRENCFYNNSQEYRDIMSQIDENGSLNMFHEASVEYRDSSSLCCLPFLRKIDWTSASVKKAESKKSIMLQGYLHNANFGDILSGVKFYDRCLKAGFRKVDFYQNGVFGIRDFCRKHTGYGTVKTKKECLNSDGFVLISGGFFWNDGKNKNDAQTRYERYIAPALHYLKRGKPVYVLGIGGGPVDTPWLREKMVQVLNKAKTVTFRDESTKKIFEGYGVTNKMEVTADTMLTVTPDQLEPFEEKYQLDLAACGRKKILLHLPDGSWENSCVSNLIVPALIRFLDEHKDYYPVLSHDNIRPMEKKERDLIAEIKKKLKDSQIQFYDYKYYDSFQMCSLLNQMDCIITSKLHVGVVGCSLEKCVVSFPVHREKTDNFYSMIGESERCVNVRDLDTQKAFEQIEKFHCMPVHIADELRKAAEKNLSILDEAARQI